MILYTILTLSVLLNILAGWYIVVLLRKFLFISQRLSDLFLTTKAFQIFVHKMYSMDSFHGEPIIQDLLIRIREVSAEVEEFREIFEYMLDKELEEELNDSIEEEAQITN
tara:strand:+ start:549 stop:878 length:330 start_codon:yes stop_codon:yes gene_type:complete